MKPKGEWTETIDLSILYALFSHFRPCDGTLEKSFFQMSSYTRASTGICIHRLWNNKWHIPCKSITWSRRELAWVRGWASPSSKYEHRRVSSLLRNIWNIRICMGEKTYRFCNLRKWRDFNKKELALHKMCYISPVWSMDQFMAVLWVVAKAKGGRQTITSATCNKHEHAMRYGMVKVIAVHRCGLWHIQMHWM